MVPPRRRNRSWVSAIRNWQWPPEPLGQLHPRQDPADQAGACRDGDAIQITQRQTGTGQRRLGTMVKAFGMGAGGDFGDDPTKGRMQRRLAFDNG